MFTNIHVSRPDPFDRLLQGFKSNFGFQIRTVLTSLLGHWDRSSEFGLTIRPVQLSGTTSGLEGMFERGRGHDSTFDSLHAPVTSLPIHKPWKPMPFIALLLALVVPMLWAATAFKWHNLVNRFRTEMPDKAHQLLPEIFLPERHPKQLWFFLTPTALDAMRDNPSLRASCLSFRRTFWALVVYPLLFVTIVRIVLV